MPLSGNKVHALTVISPLRHGLHWLGAGVLRLLKYASFGDLARLRFVHFARWVLIRPRRCPRLSTDQPRETSRRAFLLFTSNYNGPWEPYIDAFARVRHVRYGVRVIWWFTPAFAGPQRLSYFKSQIRYYEVPPDYYFCAYPAATVRDLRAALRLESELAGFAIQHGKVTNAEEFALQFGEFVTRVANTLRP